MLRFDSFLGAQQLYVSAPMFTSTFKTGCLAWTNVHVAHVNLLVVTVKLPEMRGV